MPPPLLGGAGDIMLLCRPSVASACPSCIVDDVSAISVMCVDSAGRYLKFLPR